MSRALSEPEEESVPAHCFNCKMPQQKFVKMLNGSKTKNEIGVCVNPKCFRYTDTTKESSWVRVMKN